MLTRREMLISSAGLAAAGSLSGCGVTMPRVPAVVTTWGFGPKANAAAWRVLGAGGSAIDAVEAGINDIELDPAVESVGYDGTPNSEGETTLDSMIMWGPTHEVGAVGCLKRVKRAISVARKVLEETKHSFLVGEDATRFALKMGFKEETLTGDRSRTMWKEWVAGGRTPNHWEPEPIGDAKENKDHDTISMIAVDRNGDICAGCSTNGLDFKIPGRVGDSPIAGAGAYCDNDVGGAVATGNGDVMMRFLPTYQAVELMRRGLSPQLAARKALERIVAKGYTFGGAIICMNKMGEHGAARIGEGIFPYGARTASYDRLIQVVAS